MLRKDFLALPTYWLIMGMEHKLCGLMNHELNVYMKHKVEIVVSLIRTNDLLNGYIE